MHDSVCGRVLKENLYPQKEAQRRKVYHSVAIVPSSSYDYKE